MTPSRPAEPVFQDDRVGDVLILTVLRNVSSLSNSNLERQVTELLAQHRPEELQAIVVDFQHVEWFGSLMFEALLLAWHQISPHGGRMLLCGLREFAREIVEVSQYHRLWPIFDTRELALAHLAETA